MSEIKYSSGPVNSPHPTAPPSYDEAMLRQPAFNPQVMSQQHVQGAYPVPQAMPMPTPANVVVTPVPTVAVQVGPLPATMLCPHCQKRVKTVTTTENQKSAHLAALVLCILGCCLCSCIPYCISSFKDVHHKCPDCRGFIGTYKH